MAAKIDIFRSLRSFDMGEMSEYQDVIIIGGGIVGCTIAYRLAQSKVQVTLLERGEIGREASRAAAGMLAPQAEMAHNVPAALQHLFDQSHALYPAFISELENDTGIRIGYRKSGSLMVATDFVETKILTGLLQRQMEAGKPAEELDVRQVGELEPVLKDTAKAALFFPTDHHVDNRQLLNALATAVANLGTNVQTGTRVLRLRREGAQITAVETNAGMFRAQTVIMAAGAWSGIFAQEMGLALPVRPVKGQILRLQVRPQPLNRLIHTASCYIVPWPDGRILVGATMENAGFNKEVTVFGIRHLTNALCNLIPSLASAKVTHTWAGLRPDTPDNMPILGTTPIDNLLVATGHFRNGILLAPLTAGIIAEIVTSGKSSFPLEEFSISRFQK